MGQVGSKTRSLCQILKNPFERPKGQIFSPILMKLGQNVCINNISDEFENESSQTPGEILGKTRCVCETLMPPETPIF